MYMRYKGLFMSVFFRFISFSLHSVFGVEVQIGSCQKNWLFFIHFRHCKSSAHYVL